MIALCLELRQLFKTLATWRRHGHGKCRALVSISYRWKFIVGGSCSWLNIYISTYVYIYIFFIFIYIYIHIYIYIYIHIYLSIYIYIYIYCLALFWIPDFDYISTRDLPFQNHPAIYGGTPIFRAGEKIARWLTG